MESILMARTRAEHRTRGARVVGPLWEATLAKKCLCGDVARKYPVSNPGTYGGQGKNQLPGSKNGDELAKRG